MPKLILFRHAKSDWTGDVALDFDRPLAARGLRDAPIMGLQLTPFITLNTQIFCSSAVRTRQTYELASRKWPSHHVQFSDDLYEMSADRLYSFLCRLSPVDTVMLIAHNPGLFMLLMMLSGHPPLNEGGNPFPTATVAVLDFEGKLTEGRVNQTIRLSYFKRPKDVNA